VPEQLRAAAAFEVDAGTLVGVPSSVIDVTGPEPRVLREGPGLERALELLR
jgi:tRNA A37 threonylcarbamoyladenosine synthetase subunit TsaC/SUA5/YrdC